MSVKPIRQDCLCAAIPLVLALATSIRAEEPAVDFLTDVAPIIRTHCLNCHGAKETEGGLDLSQSELALRGGDSGAAIAPGDPDASLLIDYVSGEDPLMPQSGDPLTPRQVDVLRRWIAAGAHWPDGYLIQDDPRDWWSLRPLHRPQIPRLDDHRTAWTRNPIDAFVAARHAELGLQPADEADRRTLIRRLYYDLIGLPPDPDEVEAFVRDSDPLAYETLVDRLLNSPHYGERWARHWLDVVHYGDTHGYDKDKPRPHAWPYRDYVIRSLNEDKPYARFIREQIAGDVLFPGDADGVIATGMIAAGPWDFISHVEVPETKIDGRIARNIDRDDMVRTVIETFCSVTVGCARCHDHKFDPITQQDYYNLQAVFAAVDRADRPYDADPRVYRERLRLLAERRTLQERQTALDAEVARLAGDELRRIDEQLASLSNSTSEKRPEFGYHSGIEPVQDATKWVQVDLGAPTEMASITYVGCHDDFNGIGAGFGFPVRYRIEASDDPTFASDVMLIEDRTSSDVPNPGVTPQTVDLSGRDAPLTARYVRVTAVKLAPRLNDYIFALAELRVTTPDGRNASLGRPVTALDSIEAPVRWRRSNLVDGYYFGVDSDVQQQIAELKSRREALIARRVPPETLDALADLNARLAEVGDALEELPAPQHVYAAAAHFEPQGNFRPTRGEPREIHVLHRGNVLDPRAPAEPGAPAVLDHLPSRFELPADHDEGQRRAALAEWIIHPENPLTWRSIVNRVWQYHFGRGLCETPGDFGRMGAAPTHPELLDWLAVEFRDGGGSLKSLHRLICTSATYRQASESPEPRAGSRESDAAKPDSSSPRSALASQNDSDNRFLWHFPRRRLEAEAVRDAVLYVAGKLDLRMYGPGFQDFVIEQPEHSPHYEYHLHDPEDPASHRRAVYRFIVRSQQQPFMTTLDCADPSMQVDRRNETVTALQSLALLNNKLMVAMSAHFADRAAGMGETLDEQVAAAFRLTLSREPTENELSALSAYAQEHGLQNTCRLLFNLNEFVFVD